MMRNSISYIVLGALISLCNVQAATVEKMAMPGFEVEVNVSEHKASPISPGFKMTTKFDEAEQPDEEQESLFQGYDEQAIASEPAEITAEGQRNIVTQLDQLQRNDSRRSDAVSNSRAVQRAVSYKVRGKRYTTLSDSDGFVQTGRASWYGKRFHGRKTASGERFDMNALTAAHKELPLGTKIEVINNANGKSVVVTVNDRGPFHGNRVIDLSRAAAKQLGVIQKGTADVTIRAL